MRFITFTVVDVDVFFCSPELSSTEHPLQDAWQYDGKVDLGTASETSSQWTSSRIQGLYRAWFLSVAVLDLFFWVWFRFSAQVTGVPRG